MKAVHLEAAELAKARKRFVLATVVNTKGSTPQKPGAALLVREDGSTVGTLGGGCVEGDIWFAAKEALREGVGPLYKDYYLNEDIAARDGLVCGGSMYFFIEPVVEGAAYSPVADEIASAYEGGVPVGVATVVNSTRLALGSRLIVREDGTVSGTLGDPALDAEAEEAAKAVTPLGKTHHISTEQGDEIIVVGYTSPATLVLMGGGHVNLSVARVAQSLGFRVMVTDDRREFANKERFSMAELVSVGAYDEGLDAFPITPNTAIVVATRGHGYDDMALEKAARSPAAYVGLIGSKRKTMMIHESLLKHGVPLERVKDIHAPIGLDLGGRAPEEIAISIMAEILAFRHGRDGGTLKLDEAQIDRIHAKVSGAKVSGAKASGAKARGVAAR